MSPRTKSRATTSYKPSEDPKNIFSKAWHKAKTEQKNKNQLKRYTTRLTELQKIKQPNDWQKNQIAHAQSQIKKYSPKTNNKKVNSSKKKVDSSEKKVNSSEKKVDSSEKKIIKSEKKVDSSEKKIIKSEKKNNKEVLKNNLNQNNNKKSNVKTEKPDPLKDYRRGEGTKLGKDTRITKHLKKSGWSEDRLAAKRKAHAEWKANRKNKNKLKKTKGG